MQIGDLSRARTPAENSGSLPLWARFLFLVSAAVLAAWLVPSPPSDDAGEEITVIASAAPPTSIMPKAAAPGPAAPTPIAMVEPPKAYLNPVPPEPVQVLVSEAEPPNSPAYTGSNPVAEAGPPPQPAAPKAVEVPVRTQVASVADMTDRMTPVVQTRRLVDLNGASVQDLNSLRGAGLIGKAIMRGRPYGSVEDLVKKRVVNRSLYSRIKDQVTVR